MLLREAEAALGEEGGEALLKTQGGDGERDGERPRVGLLLGLCLGEKAWSIRPLRSWNICFCGNKGERRGAVSKAQRGRRPGKRAALPGGGQRKQLLLCSTAQMCFASYTVPVRSWFVLDEVFS